MSGDTPSGSPDGLFPVTRRKLPMLIAARRTPVGASSDTTSRGGMIKVSRNDEHPQLILKLAAGHANFRDEAGMFSPETACCATSGDWASEDNDRIPLLDAEKQQKMLNSGPSRANVTLQRVDSIGVN